VTDPILLISVWKHIHARSVYGDFEQPQHAEAGAEALLGVRPVGEDRKYPVRGESARHALRSGRDVSVPRTALVTGGAKRIGRAVVEDLAAHGYAVAIHCHRSRKAAAALAAGLAARHGVATAVVAADLADLDKSADVVGRASEALGPIGLLVNSAAIFEADTLETVDAGSWSRHMAINAAAPVLLAQAFAAALPAGAEGVVVNLIDSRVWRPSPRFFSYAASKATLLAVTRTMAQALSPRIRVMAIGPGPVMKSPYQDDAEFERLVATLPLQRPADAAEIAAAIRFIVATPSMTGQMLALDGGRFLDWRTADFLDTGD
jgi:NAD(P)-dependent dehydrogenase (short-subunit alcohol dehydrogenase family)